MDLMDTYKQEQLVKQEQRERVSAVNSTAFNLFLQECARFGIPRDEEETSKLIERCFIISSTVQDYLRKQFDPFI